MTGALAVGALALLVWPDRRPRRRLQAVVGPRAGGGSGRVRAAAVPVPVAAAVASAAVAAVLSTPVVAALAGATAFVGGRSWDGLQRERRAEVRLQALTEGLGALGADLRSGRSFPASIDSAVDACADPAAGAALARALRAPRASPVPDQDDEVAAALGRVSAGVLLSTRTGCSLAAVTAAVEDDLRARHRLRTELRTATAGPRASAMLLAALPVLGLAMGSGVGVDPWRVLTTTGTGQVLLVVGVALELAGLTWTGHLARRALR